MFGLGVVSKLLECMGTAFLLLKVFQNASRTIFRPNMHNIAGFCKFILIILYGVIPLDARSERAGARIGPRHQFPLGSPTFALFLFYETATDSGCLQ